ncbi:MAG: hypothetical protein JWQ73_858 [Variovorax sp.]|nr:hypothetical protein [Variovorax sp.]
MTWLGLHPPRVVVCRLPYRPQYRVLYRIAARLNLHRNDRRRQRQLLIYIPAFAGSRVN